MASLEEQLTKAVEARDDLRALVTEAHETLQAIRFALREGADLLTKIETACAVAIDERVTTAVHEGLEGYIEEVREATDKGQQHILDQFTRWANLILYGNEQGRGGESIMTGMARKHRPAVAEQIEREAKRL